MSTLLKCILQIDTDLRFFDFLVIEIDKGPVCNQDKIYWRLMLSTRETTWVEDILPTGSVRELVGRCGSSLSAHTSSIYIQLRVLTCLPGHSAFQFSLSLLFCIGTVAFIAYNTLKMVVLLTTTTPARSYISCAGLL